MTYSISALRTRRRIKSWRFALEGKNILDEEYRVAGYDFGNPGVGATGGLSQIGFYGPPRTVAVTATYKY